MNFKHVLIGLCILVIAEPAIALRCGSKLVNDGDHMAKILKYCGEPTVVQVRTIVRGYDGGYHRSRYGRDYAYGSHNEIIVEEWTYNFGPRKFMQTIIFENGLVVSVRQLRSGYRE